MVAQSGDGTVLIYDANSFALAHRVELESDADNVRYDERSKRAYVGFGDGGIAAVDVERGEVTSRVALPAHPESFQLGDSRLFVNVPGASQIAIADRGATKLLKRWTLDAAHANYPMALDEPDSCVYVGCRRSPRLLAIDTATGAVQESHESGVDCHDVFYVGSARRLYLSCGDGKIGVCRRSDGCSLERIGEAATARGARHLGAISLPEVRKQQFRGRKGLLAGRVLTERKLQIPGPAGEITLSVFEPKAGAGRVPGLFWIHGRGIVT